MATHLRAAVERHLAVLEQVPGDELLRQRERRLAGFGAYSES